MNPLPGNVIDRSVESAEASVPLRRRLEDDDISLVAVLNVLLRHRRPLILVPFVLATLMLAAKLHQPRTFTAAASFIPQHSSSRQGSALANVAAQLGFSLPSARPSESPAFYADLLRSRSILGALVDTRFTDPNGGATDSVTLIQVYETSGTSAARSREAAIGRLSRDLGVTPSRQTDIVRLTARAQSPVLAREIADRALQLVNEFDLEKRRTQAREERRFVEARLAAAREELRAAEMTLRDFLQRNREFSRSPDLLLRHDALEREVLMRQEVFTSLAQAYEQARIEEVRNLPVITVLDAPEQPVRPDRRGTVASVLFAAIVGFIIATLFVVFREFFGDAERRPGVEYREFARMRKQALSDLRRPWRLLKRERSSSRRAGP